MPLFVALNGPQGCGKTSLASELARVLNEEHHIIPITFNLDIFLFGHYEQELNLNGSPETVLLKRTHNIPLAATKLDLLKDCEPFCFPAYDFTAQNGEGDRIGEDAGPLLKTDREKPVRIVIIEGWFILAHSVGREGRERMREQAAPANPISLLPLTSEWICMIDVELTDSNIEIDGYHKIWRHLDVLIHIEAEDLATAYEWRLEAEHRAGRLKEVTDLSTEESKKVFCEYYIPSTELHAEGLRKKTWTEWRHLPESKSWISETCMLWMKVDKERMVVSAELF